jgi:serine/threonine-protein kinase
VLGQSIGNYRIVGRLGEGGMGVVYLAEHPRIGRKVAIKTVHPNRPLNADSLERFANEAWAANSIRHPHIVEIFDFGTLPDGRAYLVMEHLEGESLDRRLARQGRFPEDRAVHFACQVAQALAAAHDKGVVHRDLKPQNLFLARGAGGAEQIKVLDFGVAKLDAQPWQSSSSTWPSTHSGTLLGTPLYASPEQLRSPRSVDHRSDVYALGVILYEMVCGRAPFVGESLADIIDQHLNRAALPPRHWVPELSARLDELILACLAKDRDHRVQGMRELLVRLGAPVSAPGETLPEGIRTASAPPRVGGTSTLSPVSPSRTGRLGRRSAWLLAAGIVLVVGASLSLTLFRRGERAAQPAANPGMADVGVWTQIQPDLVAARVEMDAGGAVDSGTPPRGLELPRPARRPRVTAPRPSAQPVPTRPTNPEEILDERL